MYINIEKKLIVEFEKHMRNNDPSHDIAHAKQVLNHVKKIQKFEGGDIMVLIAAALGHDSVIYSKDDPRSPNAPKESSDLTRKILGKFPEYTQDQINLVSQCIEQCSFRKTDEPDTIEVKILRDADKLEATGIHAIMRTYASCGQMGKIFYHPNDPFCEERKCEPFIYALDLFYDRLLVVESRLYTNTAKEIAVSKTKFLQVFLDELKRDLQG